MASHGRKRPGGVAFRSEAALGTKHRVEVNILEPIEIWVLGKESAPAGCVRRSILGLLALRAGRVVDA